MEEEARGKEKWDLERRKRQRDWDSNVESKVDCNFHVSLMLLD